jgi:predicted nuclease with TOPRIM domain
MDVKATAKMMCDYAPYVKALRGAEIEISRLQEELRELKKEISHLEERLEKHGPGTGSKKHEG